MTVEELIGEHNDFFNIPRKVCKSRVIALHAGTGKIMFDTSKNKDDYIRTYYDWKVSSLWASVKTNDRNSYTSYVQTVIMCYISTTF